MTERSGWSHWRDNHPTHLFYLEPTHGRASVPSLHPGCFVLMSVWEALSHSSHAFLWQCPYVQRVWTYVLTRSFRRQIYPAVSQMLTPCLLHTVFALFCHCNCWCLSWQIYGLDRKGVKIWNRRVNMKGNTHFDCSISFDIKQIVGPQCTHSTPFKQTAEFTTGS